MFYFINFAKAAMSNYNESPQQITQATQGYVMQQTMLRIRDPEPSILVKHNRTPDFVIVHS